jgi:hypothetical protein
MSKKNRLPIAAALLALVGAGVPLLERWFKCLDATSEGCVWAKAYLPLSFALWTIVGAVVAAIAWHLLRGKGR